MKIEEIRIAESVLNRNVGWLWAIFLIKGLFRKKSVFNKSRMHAMEQLMEFNDLMDRKGAPQFNKRKYIRQDDSICHFVITRCIFEDFFAEVGTPELTKLFCDLDREFFPKAFPDFKFHRGSSWKNIIAYGMDHCEFLYSRRKSKITPSGGFRNSDYLCKYSTLYH
jgi:hypothetical protein